MTITADDARDLQIHAHIERMCIWLGDVRGYPRERFYASLQKYMRGVHTDLAPIIANGVTAICESQKISPPVSRAELFERIECFIENDDEHTQSRASAIPPKPSASEKCAAADSS